MSQELEMETREEKPQKKSRLKPMLLVLLFLALCGGGYWFWDSQMTSPPPPPSYSMKKPAPKKSRASEAAAREPVAPSSPLVPQYGDLEEYARLEAEASMLAKKKDIAALKAEIEKLSNPPSTEKNAGSPGITQKDVLDLVSQEIGRHAENAGKAARKAAAFERLPVFFVAIEGVGNSIRAIVREPDGSSLTLRPGSSFRGGKVSTISRSGMAVSHNGKRIFYPFQ